MPAAGSSAGGRRRPSCASTTRPSRLATSTSPTPTSSSSSTRPTSTSCRATMAVVDAECGPESGAQALDRELVERWLGHRNDVSALAPLWRGGIVVDTAEVVGPLGRAPRALRGGHRRAHVDRGHARRIGAPVPRVHRRRLPLLHVRRARARRRRRLAGALLPARLGCRHRGHAGPRRRHQPPPRHRAQPVPLLPARPRLGVRGPAGAQGHVRPVRASSIPGSSAFPPPSAPRPGHERSRGAASSSSTSAPRVCARRWCGPTPPSTTNTRSPCCPTHPPPAWWSSTRPRMADAVLTVAPPALDEGGPVAGVGIANQRASSIVWERATREAGRPRASAGRTCAPSAPASSCRPRGSAWHPTPPPPRSWPSSTTSTPSGHAPSRRAVLRDRGQLGGLDALGRRGGRRRAARHRRHQRRRDRAGRPRHHRLGRSAPLEA